MKAIVSGATSTTTGSTYKLQNTTDIHTIQVVFTGTVTALVVDILGSIDGANQVVLATHTFTSAEISAKVALFHIVNRLVEYVSANITTYTGSGPVTVNHSPANNQAYTV